VELPSLLALRSKSSSNLKAIPMSLSVVRHAVKQGKRNVTETVATGHDGKCSRQYVLSAAKTLKYHLSLVKADRYIVVIATVSKD